MNYDQTLNDWIEAWNADKSIPQPYRNAVASSARRLHLESIGARSLTNQTPPEGTDSQTPNIPPGALDMYIDNRSCICPEGGAKQSCPVHGWK